MKEDLLEENKVESKEEVKEKNQEELVKENHKKEVKEKNKIKEKEINKQDEKDKSKKEVKEINKQDEKNKSKKEDKKIKDDKEFSEKDNDKKIKDEKNKSEKEPKSEKKKGKKAKKIIISSIIFIIIALLFSTIFALININNEKIITGVSIKGIEVSGLTKEEAIAKLETIYTEKSKNNIMLHYADFESELNPTLMEVKYDIEKAVNEAYSLGRNGNIFINNYNILGTLIGKKDLNVDMTINEETTKQTIIDIGANLPGIMVESSYSIEEDKLIITKGKEGIVINTESLLTEVKDMLNDINENENVIEIPVEIKQPQEIDIDKIHSEVYKEPQDAYYTKDPFTIYPEVEGVDFDVEQAKQIIASEDKEEYIIDLVITKPNVTIEQIGTEAFPDQLSTFSTRYDASDKDRTTNLVLACQKINGKVIMPGETFSYNETLGPRTYAAGYRNAKVYENGQVVDGLGGGICQISSTLYNSALMSDMEIVERRNHQFVTSYVKEGRDATVVYGLTDFKFKNTRTYPVRIVASAKSGVATVSIYGIKEADREYTYSFRTEVISTIPYTTKYVDDASLSAGQEVVKQKGANGLVCQTYMTKMLNGKIVSTKLLSKDTYSAMQRIINRSTSSTTTQNSTTSTETNTEVNETVTEETTQNPEIKPEETQDAEQNTQNEITQ